MPEPKLAWVGFCGRDFPESILAIGPFFGDIIRIIFLQKPILTMPQMVDSFFLVDPDVMQNWIFTAWSLTFGIMFYL